MFIMHGYFIAFSVTFDVHEIDTIRPNIAEYYRTVFPTAHIIPHK